MKIIICLPVYRDTRAEFTVSLTEMVIWFLSQRVTYNGEPVVPKLEVALLQGTVIHRARERLAERALAERPDYLLWLDSDQTFPPDMLARLLLDDKDIVGCNTPRRTVDAMISAASNIVDGQPRPIEPKRGGLEPVDLPGFSACLIKAGVFEALPRPWFVQGPNGEDGYFFEQAKKHGFQPYVDHSIKVGHVTETVISFEA